MLGFRNTRGCYTILFREPAEKAARLYRLICTSFVCKKQVFSSYGSHKLLLLVNTIIILINVTVG